MSSNLVKFPGKRRSHPPILTEGKYDALSDYIKTECTAIVTERKTASRPLRQTRRGSGINIRTLCFRSYDLIVESDEADLVRDVCSDVDKAQTKLKALRRRFKGVQEQAAAQVQLLSTAETKLTAAIVAALLSGKR